jgi:hypothetical protein
MTRRIWLLVLAITPLAGCGRNRSEVQDVQADLEASVHDQRPGNVATQPSPYNVRGVGPTREDQPVEAVQVGHTATAPEKGPDPLPLQQPEQQSAPSQLPPDVLPGQQTGRKEEKPKPEDPLVAVVRCYREDRAAEAQERLKAFDPGTREVLSVLLPILVSLAEPGKAGDPPRVCSTLLEHLEKLTQALRPRAALEVEKMCFCRSIERFGVFDPLPTNHVFQGGGEGRPGDLVQVYVELRNFADAKNGTAHDTKLACTLLIRDEQNHVVWRQDRPAQVERSSSPRHDGYLPCHFYVPPHLPVGDYTLWIVVKDLTSCPGEEAPPHRTARRSLDFRVRGPVQGASPAIGG